MVPAETQRLKRALIAAGWQELFADTPAPRWTDGSQVLTFDEAVSKLVGPFVPPKVLKKRKGADLDL